MSFKNIESKILVGDRFSPCLTPLSQLKKAENVPVRETQDLILLYILYITWNIFPLILLANIFCQRLVLLTVSKADEKSTYAQNTFFIFCFSNLYQGI